MRGRKLFRNSFLPPCKCWNLSPWGDGNVNCKSFLSAFWVEIYPREGTETLLMQTPPVHFGQLKFIPVRGRRLKATIYITALCKVKIYPREGTETLLSLHSHVWRRLRWNLSPWGDGNNQGADAVQSLVLKYIPVRGRKLYYCIFNRGMGFWLKFIPVRGRKQPDRALRTDYSCWNLSPWGDGNQVKNDRIITHGWNLSPWGDGNHRVASKS